MSTHCVSFACIRWSVSERFAPGPTTLTARVTVCPQLMTVVLGVRLACAAGRGTVPGRGALVPPPGGWLTTIAANVPWVRGAGMTAVSTVGETNVVGSGAP